MTTLNTDINAETWGLDWPPAFEEEAATYYCPYFYNRVNEEWEPLTAYKCYSKAATISAARRINCERYCEVDIIEDDEYGRYMDIIGVWDLEGNEIE